MSWGPRFALLAIGTASLSVGMFGAIREVRSYSIDSVGGSHVQAALAVAPDQSVLLLIPKRSGVWKLKRLQTWWGPNPIERSVDVPGIVLPDKSEIRNKYMLDVGTGLLVMPGGDLAIGSAVAHFKNAANGNVSEDVLEWVIDLRTFEVVNAVRHEDAQVFQFSRAQRYADRLGRLVEIQDAYAGDNFSDGSSSQEYAMNFLTLPGLLPYGNCGFSVRQIQNRVTLNNGLCGPSLPALLDGLVDSRGLPYRGLAPHNSNCEVTAASRDRRFQAQSCVGRPGTIIYARGGSEIGAINEDTRNSSSAHFAEYHGHRFLLVLERGAQLKVYEIAEIR